MGNESEKSGPRTLSTPTMTLEVITTLKQLNGATVTEMADELECSKGGVYNHLATLRENDFIVKHENVYKLSPRFILIGEHARHDNILYQFGKDELDNLIGETGEYGQLITEEHGFAIVVYLARGEKAIGSDYPDHMKMKPLHMHHLSAGKAIMSHLPRKRVDAIVDKHGLKRRTENTLTNREQLYEELEQIREQGYAYNDEEEVEGLRAVGAPVFGLDGDVLGALSLSGPKSRLHGDKFDTEIPEMVQETADIIEINIKMARNTDQF